MKFDKVRVRDGRVLNSLEEKTVKILIPIVGSP